MLRGVLRQDQLQSLSWSIPVSLTLGTIITGYAAYSLLPPGSIIIPGAILEGARYLGLAAITLTGYVGLRATIWRNK